MKRVQLLRLQRAIEESLSNDANYLDAMVDANWSRVATIVHELVGRPLTAVPVSVDEIGWEGYFVLDADTRVIVGSCAFKGEPTDDGTAEIAYLTYPEFEGQGYATSMAEKLLQLAKGCPTIKRVIANTLPEVNASTSVLKKVAMSFVGEVVDPEDGVVWQWQAKLPHLS